MSVLVHVASPGTEPGAIQGRVREVIRELAASLRPDLPFIDAMSSRQGWDVEGIAGSGGVGARASFRVDALTYSLTLRAISLDESTDEQEWSVTSEVIGPRLSGAGRQRGSLLVIVGFHGGVVGALGIYFLLQPLVDTTASVLAIGLAIPLGIATGALVAKVTPPAPEPPDLHGERDTWMREVRNALTTHHDLRIATA